jgi:hemoglobin-like flavoprotein
MTVDKNHVNEVNLSLGRCFLQSGFMDKFYANFKASHAAIPPFFVKTDMSRQHKLLKEGITFLLMSAGGSQFAQNEIAKLGVRHDPAHLNVKPELYQYWVDSLLKTVREFDQHYTPELDAKWRATLDAGIQQMINKYNAPKKTA